MKKMFEIRKVSLFVHVIVACKEILEDSKRPSRLLSTNRSIAEYPSTSNISCSPATISLDTYIPDLIASF